MDTRNYLKVGKSLLHLSKPATRQAIEFFAKHAGYCVPPGRMACAKHLAQAEQLANDKQWMFSWEPDTDDYEGSLGDHEYWCEKEQRGIPHQHEVYYCQLWANDGNTMLASLCGILDPDRNYRRVVEAELALEAAEEN